MAFTAAEIKNLALTEINHETITDWTDPSNTDIPIITQQYELALKNALAAYPWSFAAKYVKLATTDTPNTNALYKKYTKIGTLPTDALGQITASTSEQFNTLADFMVVGTTIYCNMDPIYVKYNARVDEANLSPEFVDWFKTFFAMRLNSYLNGDMQRQSYLQADEPILFKKAKNIDSHKNPHQALTGNPLLWVRGNMGGGII
ncbi:MAG: hypothetical protein II219_02565 [Alphaproteobacteria bacterium]|nr:hypothetical protein [Alphaproteobacteria bacterium]